MNPWTITKGILGAIALSGFCNSAFAQEINLSSYAIRGFREVSKYSYAKHHVSDGQIARAIENVCLALNAGMDESAIVDAQTERVATIDTENQHLLLDFFSSANAIAFSVSCPKLAEGKRIQR